MNKWDSRFLDLAKLIATWSKDSSTKVGSAIVDQKNRVVSLGFNGYARGVHDSPHDRDKKLRLTIHAEENSLLFAKQDLEGYTLYVTHHPCARCAAKIIQAGISRVVVGGHMHEKWAEETVEASLMFDSVGVEVEVLDE